MKNRVTVHNQSPGERAYRRTSRTRKDKLRRFVFALTGLFLLAADSHHSSAAAQQATRGGATLFTGARLITDGDMPPIQDSAFLVEGDRITKVGTRNQLQVPAGTVRVDLTGKTVIPAMVNAHGHLGFLRDTSLDQANYTRENIINQLRQYAYYGVGAIMTAGTDAGEVTYDLRAHPVPGAALVRTAGRGFAMPNASTGGVQMRGAPYGVRSEAEARSKVREIAARKPDMIKIWVDDRGGTVQKLPPAIYRAIIDEAHKHGIRVMAHEFYLADARDLVEAGVDGFLHSVRDAEIDDALVARMKQKNVFITPNLAIAGQGAATGGLPWQDDPLLGEVFSPAAIALVRGTAPSPAQRASYQMQIRSLMKLSRAGVTIALGDDTGIQNSFPGYAALRQMERMAEAGMTPQQVLVAVTRTSAQVLRMADMGSIAAGKQASFIVLDADPLEDLANARKISRVYLRGQEIDRSSLREQFREQWNPAGGTSAR